MEKIFKKIDGLCSNCGSSQMVVEIGEELFDGTIVCSECGKIVECPKCSSRKIGYFESFWICGDCTHGFNRYPEPIKERLKEIIQKLKKEMDPDEWDIRVSDMQCYFSGADGFCYSTPKSIASLVNHHPEDLLHSEACCGTEMDKDECPIYQLLFEATKTPSHC